MAELKFFDTNLGGGIAATMARFNLTEIPEGNGESERIARKILVKKISINYNISLPTATTAGSTTDTMRCMLILDKQTNGAIFTAVQLLDTDSIFSFNHLANNNRFRILFKENYDLKAGGAAASGAAFIFSEDNTYLMFTINVNIPIEYDNSVTTGDVSSVKSNNIYWVTQSRSGIGIGLGAARIRYIDN